MSDLHEGDQRLIAGVVNRMGTHELTDALENIFARLEKIEEEIFPPEAETAEAGAQAVGEETVPQTEEGTGSEEGQSSSDPESEPAPVEQSQSQSY